MANFCMYCGTPVEENGVCGNPECPSHAKVAKEIVSGKSEDISLMDKIKKRIGLQSISSASETFERDKLIVPNNVTPDVGEVPIRQYHIASLRSILKGMYAEGRLQVTNKRVLFRAAGISFLGTTELQYEFAIDEIAGIEIRRDHRIGVFNLILACVLASLALTLGEDIMGFFNNVSGALANILSILLGIGSIALFFLTEKKFALKLGTLSVVAGAIHEVGFSTKYFIIPVSNNAFFTIMEGAVLILMLLSLILIAFVPNLVVAIKTKGASSPIEIRRKESNGILAFMFNMPKKDYTGVSDVMPGRDTAKAMQELGAMINDLNTLGDGAIDKWKK